MGTKSKKYHNLTVYTDGASPGFILDDEALKSFEEAFEGGKPQFSFIDHNDDGEVVLRNNKLAGYKKSELGEEASRAMEDIESKDKNM